MHKVQEKLTQQMSTLATERHIAEPPPKSATRGTYSPTGTDSSSSTLREDGSIESLSSLVNDTDTASRDAKIDASKAVTAKARKASPPSALKGERPSAEPKRESSTRDSERGGIGSSKYGEVETNCLKAKTSDVTTPSTTDAASNGRRDRGNRDGTDGKDAIRTLTYSGSREGSRTGSRNSSFEARDLVRSDKKYTSKYLLKDTTGDFSTAKLSSSYPTSEGRGGIRDHASRSATIERYSSYASRGSKDTPKPSEVSGSDRSATLDNRTHRDTSSRLLSRESNSLGKSRKEADSIMSTTATKPSVTMQVEESKDLTKAAENTTPDSPKPSDGSASPNANSLSVSYGKVLSPKSKHKHRPTTPEPLSPDITDTKLLQTPERMARRKSVGMMPILHFKMDTKKSETLVEEEDGACSSPVSKEVPTELDNVSSSSVVEDGVQGKKLEKGVKPSGGEKLIESGVSSPTKSRNSSSENLRFSPSLARRSRNLDSGSESPSSRTKTVSSENLRYIATTSPTISRRARGEAKTYSSENLQNSLASSPTSTVRPGSRSQGNSSDAVAAAASSPTEAAPTSSQTTPRPTLSSENLRHSPVISRKNRNDGSSSPTKAYSREDTQPTDTTSSSFSTRTGRYDGTSSPTKARTFGREGSRLSDRTSTLDTTRSSRYEGATSPVKSGRRLNDSTDSSYSSRYDRSSSPTKTMTLGRENRRRAETVDTSRSSRYERSSSPSKALRDSSRLTETLDSSRPSSSVSPTKALGRDNVRLTDTADTSRRSKYDRSSSPTRTMTLERECKRLNETSYRSSYRSRFDDGSLSTKVKTSGGETANADTALTSKDNTVTKPEAVADENSRSRDISTPAETTRPSSRNRSTKSETLGDKKTGPSEDSTASVDTVRPSSRTRNDGCSSPSARKTLSSENVRSSVTSSPTETTPPSTKSDVVPAATEKSSSRNSSPTTPMASSSNQASEIARPHSRNRQASEKATSSSRNTSPTSSRPSSRNWNNSDRSTATKPPSPTPAKVSKYSSCTENAFTSNNSPFMAAEKRPVLRRTGGEVVKKDLSPASRSLSSLTNSPAEQVWRESSSVGSSRRLSAAPVRGRPYEVTASAPSPTPNRTSEGGADEGRASPKPSTSPTKVLPKDEKETLDNGISQSSRDSSPNLTVEIEKSPVRKSPTLSRRAYVQREQSDLEKLDIPGTSPVEKDANSKAALNVDSPKIIVRSPTLSEADKPKTLGAAETAKDRPATIETPTSSVRIRQKSPASNHMYQARKSWRQTPVIAPDVVEMILTGELFEFEDGEEGACLLNSKKLDTCMEEEEPIRKFSPVTTPNKKFSPVTTPNKKFSPIAARRAEKHTPILKTSKSISPDHAASSPSPEKRVSINSEPFLGEERSSRPRRKFLSADERSRTIDYSYTSNERSSSPPSPDLLSKSMDLRGDSGGFLPRLRVSSLSHSVSTPDLTEILGDSKSDAKAKRVERSNSKRRRNLNRTSNYLDTTLGSLDMPPSPRRKSGGMSSFSPRHSASSITSRLLAGTGINRALSSLRRSEKEHSSDSRNRGSRTLT